MSTKKDSDQQLDKDIGNRVREARTEAEMSQAELGRLLNFEHPSSLYRYEVGLRGFTKPQLIAIAGHLRVSIDWLLTNRVSPYGAPTKDVAERNEPSAPPVVNVGEIKPMRTAFPRVMRELYTSGRLGTVTDEDEQFLLEYFAKPGNRDHGVIDAESALLSDRYVRNRTDENFLAIQKIHERQQKVAGVKRTTGLPPEAIKKRPANDGTHGKKHPSRRKADRNRG